MKLLVLGATGATGKKLVEVALNSGHQVTAFTRKPASVPTDHPALSVAVGDARDLASLERAMPGHDAVYLLVGPRDPKDVTLRADAAKNVVLAMKKHSVKRLIALSGLGAGITLKQQSFMFQNVLAKTVLKNVLADQNAMESVLRKSLLDWIVVRPGKMVDGPATGKWTVSMDGAEISQNVLRSDVVMFLMLQAQSDEFVHKPVAIGSET